MLITAAANKDLARAKHCILRQYRRSKTTRLGGWGRAMAENRSRGLSTEAKLQAGFANARVTTWCRQTGSESHGTWGLHIRRGTTVKREEGKHAARQSLRWVTFSTCHLCSANIIMIYDSVNMHTETMWQMSKPTVKARHKYSLLTLNQQVHE